MLKTILIISTFYVAGELYLTNSNKNRVDKSVCVIEIIKSTVKIKKNEFRVVEMTYKSINHTPRVLIKKVTSTRKTCYGNIMQTISLLYSRSIN